MTVIGTCTTEPLGTSGVAWACSVLPSTETVMPCAPPGDAVNFSGSPSASVAKRARSTEASSPAATSTAGDPTSSGARFSGGRTWTGMVRTLVCPSGSSGPEPSVTSNDTDAGPVWAGSGVYTIWVTDGISREPSVTFTASSVVRRGVLPSTTSTCSVMSMGRDSPASTSSCVPGRSVGLWSVRPGTLTKALAVRPSTSVAV